MKEPVLLILAAGMGSRFGGLKQIEPVGVNGEIIMDYSLYDAVKAGFKKAVFVIKEENREEFEAVILPRAAKHLEVKFVYQKADDIPAGFSVPAGREKPWGTGHAVLAARHKIDGPFVAINADDFYGREAFAQIYRFLTTARDDKNYQYAMVGFYLKNTVTDNGYVSRGVCETADNQLVNIVERTRIEKRDMGISFSEDNGNTWNALPPEAVVSMNFWGFTQSFMGELEKDFRSFFEKDVEKNPLKAEFFLPYVVNNLIQAGKATVQVLASSDKWYGVTYNEDKEQVQQALKALAAAGKYPTPLWS